MSVSRVDLSTTDTSPSLEQLYAKAVTDLAEGEYRLTRAESDLQEQGSRDDIPLPHFMELEGRVRYLHTKVESDRKIVADLEQKLAVFREEARLRWDQEQKEIHTQAILTSLDEISAELRRLQAEYSSLPPQMQRLQFRHSQLLQELSRV